MQENAYEREEDYYFDSYGHFNIHEEMIKDKVRTETYMKAIVDNPAIFKDKVVLDVGSGTGILSIFAARAGARRVYAIEKANISKFSRKIIEENGLSDRVIVIQGKVEEVEVPEKVDVIVSEWMGYFLLYEAMLDSVIFARDKWLKPGGKMFPDKATLYLALLQDNNYITKKMGFWDDVYGISMKCMKKWVITEPTVDDVSRKRVISDEQPILSLDLETCSVKDLDFEKKFELRPYRKSLLNGFIGWFDVVFSYGKDRVISTSPFDEGTHWKQTEFYFEEAVDMSSDAAVKGTISVCKAKTNPRELDIKIDFNYRTTSRRQTYRMT